MNIQIDVPSKPIPARGDDSAMTEREINQKVAEAICDTLRWNGREFRLNQWVGLLDGEVIAVADDLTTVFHALRALTSDPQRGMVLQVGPQVDYIRRGWGKGKTGISRLA